MSKLCDLTGLPKSTMSKGRIAVKYAEHPKSNNRGYVLRSRYIMEKHLGRQLSSNEEVHHKNEDPLDDRLENLEVLTKSEHTKLHGNFSIRKLDYEAIKKLRLEGLGYKRVAKELGYAVSSVKSICRKNNFKRG